MRYRAIAPALAGVFILGAIIVVGSFAPRGLRARAATTVQNSVPVASVSAASFIGSPAALAPNSIVAGFGTQLATGIQVASTQPLPTSLQNTTVTINGTPAPLFFVSPGQVNFLVPPTLPAGDAQVVITSTASNGDQVVSRGQIKVTSVAPALFTANANGAGAPAAVTGRINGSGQFVFDSTPPFEPNPLQPGQFLPAPINVGTDQQPAFLILFATGLRNAPAGSTRALIGGVDVPVTPVPAPGFTGLEQVNLQIPTSLKGRGIVDLTLVSNGISSNPVNVNLAGTPNNAVSIAGFSVTDPAVAGQTISITGSGFSTTAEQNLVRFGAAQARVIAATSTQLTVIVPFGAESGRVTVQTPQGETRSAASLRVNTSISGLVQSTGTSSADPAPLYGVTIRVVGKNISVQTNPQGMFVIPNLSSGVELLEVDGGTAAINPPFPKVTLKATVRPDRDNFFAQAISLQQITGGSGNVGTATAPGGGPLSAIGNQLSQAIGRKLAPAQALAGPQKSVVVSDGGVSVEVPIGTAIRFPDGKTNGAIQVTLLQRSRLPGIALPKGVYSTAIAQITPLGTTFSPGASLTFPNPDPSLAPGSKVDLYRYDFAAGGFVRRGTATVSNDRALAVSDGRILDVASFWLAAATSPVTTVRGSVIDTLGAGFAGAKVSVNGRGATTDANGGFIIGDVPTIGLQQLQVEAVVPQAYGTLPRGLSSVTPVVVGGVTNVGTIALSNTNQAALVLSPFNIDFDSGGAPVKMDVTLTQPAPSGGLAVALGTDNARVASIPASVTIPAGQTTASFNVTRVGPGVAVIGARATLGGNSLTTIAVVTVARPAPTLTGVSPQSAPPGAKIVINGTGLLRASANNIVGFVRNGALVAILDPSNNETFLDVAGKPALRIVVPSLPAGAASIVAAIIDPSTGVISDTSNAVDFTVLGSDVATPTLVNLSPPQGKPRDQVTINGTSFSVIPEENQLFFRQGLIDSPARIIRSSTTQLVVEVPAANLNKGAATIFARRVSGNGARSNISNALDFTITADPAPPAKPALASAVNTATQQAAGRDGDTILLQGTNLGLNFYDAAKDAVGNAEPLVSLLLFYQNNQFINFSLPTSAQGGTRITSIVPTGLSAGQAQITTITFDLETGLLSDESNPINFNLTAGSLRRVDEDEPNDSFDTATDVSLQTIVEGSTGRADSAELSISFNDGTSEPLPDLFLLTLDKASPLSLLLNFTTSADLDLWVFQQDATGAYQIIASSTNTSGTLEQLSGSNVSPGEYLIAVGAYSGSSTYTLTLQASATAATLRPAATSRQALRWEKIPRK